MKLKDFKNKKVTVMGLGLHGGGVGTAKFFCKKGAQVTVTDVKTKKELTSSLKKLKDLPINYTLGKHKEEDFINADLIIKNPGVPQNSPFIKIAKKDNVPVETATTIFFKLCSAKIIGVTGTKGKSTVSTLIYRFLKTENEDTFLAGNIGLSPLEILDKIIKNKEKKRRETKVVLELSSFNLEDLKKSPNIALITNIYKDHLNRYKDFKDYIKAKTSIFSYQNKKDILVLNYDNSRTRKFASQAPGIVYFYSLDKKNKKGCFLKNKQVFFNKDDTPILNITDIKQVGTHNISNILGSISVAKIMGVSNNNIKKVINNFKGVPEREQKIATKKGVKYFDDTTATIPEATQVTIDALKQKYPQSRIFLIGGGVDKKLDYKKLAQKIKTEIEKVLLLPGTATEKIKKELKERGALKKIISVNSMKEAVKKSSVLSKEKDIVLLSPAAASFNLFENEFDRGKKFKKAVREIK